MKSISYFFVLFTTVSEAQFRDILDRARRAAEREVSQSIERNVGDVVGCAVGNDDCSDSTSEDSESNVSNTTSGNADNANHPATCEAPGQGVWRNYDFTPGKRVIFASDWERERVGRIPRDIRFVSGNMQLVELDGRKVLEFTNRSVFQVVLNEPLPKSYSLEYDGKAALPNVAITTYFEAFTEPSTRYQNYEYNFLQVRGETGISSRNGFVSSNGGTRVASTEITPVKFQYDNGYAVMYLGIDRVAQMPNANLPKSNVVKFVIGANTSHPAYIIDIVVAYDVDDPYGALMDQGEFTTRGIYFDFNDARLRPESAPVLTQLVYMLNDHEDLINVIIEGHTDNLGDDNYNMNLSGQRTQAVKDYLVKNGIAANRIEAVGRGESKPVADNASEAGRQENRRVAVRLP